jgi:hypothetical protein
MNWLDACAIERNRRDAHSKEIAMRGLEVFESLWRDVVRWIEEAKTKGHLLSTNGATESRTVNLEFEPLNAHAMLFPKVLKIDLAKDRSVISAVFPDAEGDIEFLLHICDDGVICMKHEGKRIYSTDAAILILRRFIFPEQNGIKREDKAYSTE